MTRAFIRFASLIALCLLLGIPCASAQGVGELRGKVTDDSGAPVPGAVVMIRDPQKRAHSVTTSADGTYAMRDLRLGLYILSVSIQGFAAADRPITLRPNGVTTVDIALSLAAEQHVEVVASLSDLRRVTGLNPTGLVMGPELLNILPNDPDVMLHVLRELSTSSGRADQVAVYVDGQPVGARIPPKATIQSIRISTNAFAPEFADPSSGVVEIITRPASKQFQGETQSTFNDSALNAKNAFETVKNPTRTVSLTGYLGGPIVPGRWSFLAYGGRWNRDERLLVNATVVDPGQSVGRPYQESVPTPTTTDSLSLRSDVAISLRHVLSAEFVRFEESALNQSLESGLDLPERATNRDSSERTFRAALFSSLSGRSTGQSTVRIGRRSVGEAAVSNAPAVLVLDTFYAGGNQALLQQGRETRNILFTNIFGHVAGDHSLRVGMNAEFQRYTEQRRTNQGGTFTFGSVIDASGTVVATPLDRYIRTLEGVPGYTPSFFTVGYGAPAIEFGDWYGSWFFQDDWRIGQGMTVSLGLRHDLQEQARSQFNFAPRAGLAWAPTGSTSHIVRVSGGLFYGRISPDVTLDTLRYDGLGVRELIVNEPDFFPEIPPILESAMTGLSTVRVKDSLDAPRTAAITSSYEWQISKPLFASVSYTYRRGDHLLRTLNINQPDSETGLRPRQDVGPVLEFSSTGRSLTQELSISVRRALTRLSVFGTYTLGSSKSDTDGPYTLAADSRTLQGEFGRAGDDQRHRIVLGGVMTFPREWSVSGIFTTGSARPFNITTGHDDDGDLLLSDRPGHGVAGEEGTITTDLGTFDLQRSAGQPMIVRNAGEGPSHLVLNVGVAKKFRLGRSSVSPGSTGPYLTVSVSGENIINRINLVDFNGVVTSPLFGTSNRALTPRRIELAARLGF